MRILVRPRTPVLALLLLAPAIPELLTGSTSITALAVDPIGFAVGFAFEVGLYGCGALLIREAAVAFHRGMPSVLLWGAAYGVVEEGLAVHTFFQRSGAPVGALATYGSAFGVNWLWALGLTVFHATYSIALPIVLVRLAFPATRGARLLDTGAVGVAGFVYLGVASVYAVSFANRPPADLFVVFLALAIGLVGLGLLAPPGALRLRAAGPGWSRARIAGAATLEWVGWLAVLIIAPGARIPAVAAGALLIGLDGLAVGMIVYRATPARVVDAEYAVAAGMLVPLFLFDAVLVPTNPGIVLLAVGGAYLLYRLGRATARGGPPAAAIS